VVASSDSPTLEVSSPFEISNDPAYRSFRYAETCCEVPLSEIGSLREREKRATVPAQQFGDALLVGHGCGRAP